MIVYRKKKPQGEHIRLPLGAFGAEGRGRTDMVLLQRVLSVIKGKVLLPYA